MPLEKPGSGIGVNVPNHLAVWDEGGLENAEIERIDALLAAYQGKMREAPDPELPKPELIRRMSLLRAIKQRRGPVPAEVAVEMPVVYPATSELFTMLVPADRREIFDAAVSIGEKQQFLDAFAVLSPKAQRNFAERLVAVSKARDEASIITSLRGAVFEMSRAAITKRQGLEEVSPDALPKVTVDFLRYPKGATTFNELPSYRPLKADKAGDIDFDVPLLRNGKPYAYETKSYPRKAFGAADPVQARNQLLKYEAGVDQGVLAGATIELRGRLDKEMLFWAAGVDVKDPGAIPNVEMIYTFPLPSGKEYRFVLKRGKRGNGLRFRNEEKYSDDDEALIRGIQSSINDKSIIQLLADVHIRESDASEELRPFLSAPETITTRAQFEEFDTLQQAAIVQRLREKAESARVNTLNKKSAVSEYATPEFVTDEIQKLQEFFKQNPAMAAVKRHYILAPEQIPVAVAQTMDTMNPIATYERGRLADVVDAERLAAERVRKGYAGRPEGVALDIEHIYTDVIYAMNKNGFESERVNKVAGKHAGVFFEAVPGSANLRLRWASFDAFETALSTNVDLMRTFQSLTGKQRDELGRMAKESAFVRSYSWPERFMNVESIPAYVQNADRRYLELQVFDEKTGKTDRIMDTNEAAIEQIRVNLVRENIERARTYIAEMRVSDPGRAEKMERAYQKPIHAIENIIVQLKQEQEGQAKVLQAAAQEKLKDISVQVAPLKQQKDRLATEKRKRESNDPELADMDRQLAALEAQIATMNEARATAFDAVRKLSALFLPRIQEQQERLLEIYTKIIPSAERELFERRVVGLVDQNIMKFIYVVTAEGNVIVQEEVLRGDVTGRAAHSELAQGRNVYGAGELAFSKNAEGVWVLNEINNGSGHYRPDAVSTLHYVRQLLIEKGIDVSQANLVDSILRGLELGRTLREESAF